MSESYTARAYHRTLDDGCGGVGIFVIYAVRLES